MISSGPGDLSSVEQGAAGRIGSRKPVQRVFRFVAAIVCEKQGCAMRSGSEYRINTVYFSDYLRIYPCPAEQVVQAFHQSISQHIDQDTAAEYDDHGGQGAAE